MYEALDSHPFKHLDPVSHSKQHATVYTFDSYSSVGLLAGSFTPYSRITHFVRVGGHLFASNIILNISY
jgi:hypothetical protein